MGEDINKKRELVRMAYRFILGREPESESHLDRWLPHFIGYHDLRIAFLNSPEFQIISSNRYKPLINLPNTIITTFEEFDEFICRYRNREMYGLDDVGFLSSYQLDFQSFLKIFGRPMPKCDPFSLRYAEWEMELFNFLSGKTYDIASEGIDHEMDPATSGQPSINDLQMLKEMYNEFFELSKIKPHEHVLEMGCGAGNLTEFLVRQGCKITAIDAQKAHIDFTAKRCGCDANVIQCEFLEIEKIDSTFDVVIFEASFHHCGQPQRLLECLRKITMPNCRIYFLRECISDSYDRPWGIVRYDGETMLQIRMRGWLELGFRTDFFEVALNKADFKLSDTIVLSDKSVLYKAVKV